MMFVIQIPPVDDNKNESLIGVDDSKDLIIIIRDIFGDNAVISLAEPQRSEFIRKIKELNHGD